MICCEDIAYFGINYPCKHSTCWNCSLKGKLKLGNDNCSYCNQAISKIIISTDPEYSQEQANLCDPDLGILYDSTSTKTFVERHLSFYCQICAQQGQNRKFQNLNSLEYHVEKAHHLHFCNLCLNQRPVLLFEQELYRFKGLKQHKDKEHPKCDHCDGKHFYEYDSLYKHYREAHFQCEVCKKLGKKKRNKKTGATEYEVYKDISELRGHYRKKHHVCKKPGCQDLVFTDQTLLASHMMTVHGEQIKIQLAFKHSDDESDELPEDYHQRQKWKQTHGIQDDHEELKEAEIKTRINYKNNEGVSTN